MSTFVMREMRTDDWPRVQRVIQANYQPSFWEGEESFAAYRGAFSQGCVVCEHSGSLVAYAIGHPWRRTVLRTLDQRELELPTITDMFFVHDICVDGRFRRMGAARLLIGYCESLARRFGFDLVAGVSVQDSVQAWGRLGYHPSADLFGGNLAVRAKYGEGAQAVQKMLEV